MQRVRWLTGWGGYGGRARRRAGAVRLTRDRDGVRVRAGGDGEDHHCGSACGFLLKRSGPALLTEAVRAAMAGEVLISPSITVRLLRHLAPRADDRHRGPTEPLTDREAEVAGLVSQGRTNAEIGTALFISADTAKTHVANIQRELGVRNRVGITAWVWRTTP